MKFYIHSSYGVLEATPMTVQAIENSIPEGQDGANKDIQATVGEQDAVSPASADETSDRLP